MRITGKTVYVLGAGASAHTGAPLLKDFLVKARMLYQSHSKLEKRDEFKRVFDRIDRLRAASYHVEFDIDNLEHVFSLAEMEKQILPNGGGTFAEDLRWVLLETLDRSRVRLARKQPQTDSTYHKFQSLIRETNEKRQKICLGDPDALLQTWWSVSTMTRLKN